MSWCIFLLEVSSCPRRKTTLTMVLLLELWRQAVLTSECVTHTSEFSLASSILLTFYHMQTNSCCLNQPRLRFCLHSSVSSLLISLSLIYFHSLIKNLYLSVWIQNCFGNTSHGGLHFCSENLKIKITIARSSSTNTK